MARIFDVPPEWEQEYARFVASCPPHVAAVARRFDPWSLYRMKSTKQRVTVYSFGEKPDGSVTLTVAVTGRFNVVDFDRRVFGIEPDDLESCELPAPDEQVGTLLTDERDIKAYVDAIRPYVLAALAARAARGE
jgi:hypothetical protein